MVPRWNNSSRVIAAPGFTEPKGADWTKRFPAIVYAARQIKAASFHIDGEGVGLRNARERRKHSQENRKTIP